MAYAGKWLDSFLTPRLSKFPPKTLIVVSWDEDDYTGVCLCVCLVSHCDLKSSAPCSQPLARTHLESAHASVEGFAGVKHVERRRTGVWWCPRG